MSAPRPRKAPSQRRSAHTVDAILEAAVRILRAEGYDGLSTRRVADVAGVSVGSLYQYFPNREAIVAELVRRRVDDFMAAAAGAAIGPVPSLHEAIAAMVEAFLAEKRRSLPLSLAMHAAMGDAHGRQVIAERMRVAVPGLARRLGEACGVAVDARRLGLAFAAIEGATWQALADDPTIVAADSFPAMLTGVAMAVLDTASRETP